MAQIRQQGLNLTTVPGYEARVTLPSIAKVAADGQPVLVNDRDRPGNARSAVQAAQALRLDRAEVDMLIQDLALSWKTSGSLICEVDAQPQISVSTGRYLYGEILRRR